MASGVSNCKHCGAEIVNVGGVGRKRVWCDDCKTLADSPEYDTRRPGRIRRANARNKLDRAAAGLADNGKPRKVRSFVAGPCVNCGEPFVSKHVRERSCSPECAEAWRAEKNRRKLDRLLDSRMDRLQALTTD